MRRILSGMTAVCAAAVLSTSVPTEVGAQAQNQALVIQGATLIDGNGGAPVPNSVIVVQGNMITAVGRQGQVQTPAGAQVVNANGKWVVPGLWDCQQNYSWFYGEPQLNQGVTSGCDIGNGDELSIAHRDAVNHGKIRGPRTWIGVAHLGGADPAELTGWETPLQTRQIPKTVEETRIVVTRLLAAGADMIMFHDGNNFTPEMVKAGCDLAHARGKPCTQRTGGRMPPATGAAAGIDMIPHSSGIGAAVQRDGSQIMGGDADRYADMDDAKAKALIDVLIREDVHPIPNIIHIFPTYPKDWARMYGAVQTAMTDPGLRAYYPNNFYEEMTLSRTRYDQGAVRERRQRSYQNMIRFHKMLIDAGGKPLIGGDTNGTKVAGYVVHEEMEIWQEGGIKPMQILQAATKWTADAMKVGDKYGVVAPGHVADLVIVNADPLVDITNLRQIDNVVFDGKVIDRNYHGSYSTTFGGSVDDIRAVEDLPWVKRVRDEYAPAGGRGGGGGGPGGGGGAAANFPDPGESPPPAIMTMTPVMVTQGAPTTAVRMTGVNFVARSRVLFDGVSVPWRRVGANEIEVTLDENLLRRAGRFDLVVVNPDPQTAPKWGNGTSNKAHMIVAYRF
jgi:imidazolonepropionase-like amidohydrolase